MDKDTQLKQLAELERAAEASLFDWLERRESPGAEALWQKFALEAQAVKSLNMLRIKHQNLE